MQRERNVKRQRPRREFSIVMSGQFCNLAMFYLGPSWYQVYRAGPTWKEEAWILCNVFTRDLSVISNNWKIEGGLQLSIFTYHDLTGHSKCNLGHVETFQPAAEIQPFKIIKSSLAQTSTSSVEPTFTWQAKTRDWNWGWNVNSWQSPF